MACILFDLDGTIQDSEKLASEANKYGFQSILNRDATQQELDYLVGKPVIKVLTVQFPEHWKAMTDKIFEYYYERSHQIKCYEGIVELLNDLHNSKFDLGIVSAKRRVNIIREMKSNSIFHLFQTIVGQEDTPHHKPHPEPLLLAADLMGYSPGECIYIGDQATDMIAAANAGMKSGAALWGEGQLDKLLPHSPSHIFTTPQSVREFFCA